MKRIAVPLALALMSQGCSWAFQRPARSAQSCSTSRVAAGFDVYQAIGNGVVGLLFLSMGGPFAIGGIAGLGFASLHTASASYGFREASACHRLKADVDHGAPGIWVTPRDYVQAPPASVPVPEPVPPEPQGEVVEEEIDEEIEINTTTRHRRKIIVR